jgi:hypothetical protein
MKEAVRGSIFAKKSTNEVASISLLNTAINLKIVKNIVS